MYQRHNYWCNHVAHSIYQQVVGAWIIIFCSETWLIMRDYRLSATFLLWCLDYWLWQVIGYIWGTILVYRSNISIFKFLSFWDISRLRSIDNIDLQCTRHELWLDSLRSHRNIATCYCYLNILQVWNSTFFWSKLWDVYY